MVVIWLEVYLRLFPIPAFLLTVCNILYCLCFIKKSLISYHALKACQEEKAIEMMVIEEIEEIM
jgi:hypothetical protein